MTTSGHVGSSDLVRAMGPVARELLGEPNAAMSSKTQLRFGAKGSVSVDLAKGLWFDHQAGEGGGVLDFLRVKRQMHNGSALSWLEERGLLENSRKSGGKPAQAPRSWLRPVLETYPYVDVAGNLLFENVRFADGSKQHRFSQRRPDGRGGWKWNLHGVERVPYLLPELLSAIGNGEPIFFCEGEKDVHAVTALGLFATTTGSSSSWQHGFGDWFNGANVTILPDNDDAGRRHASAVASGLQGHAHRVGILELPGLPDKGDVSDWIAAGGTASQLEEMAEGAPEFVARAESAPSDVEQASHGADVQADEAGTALQLIDPRALAGVPIPPREWIVEDWLPFGHVTISYGDGGVGKTLLSQQLMTAAATGAYWCGLTVQRCRVFGLFCEDDQHEVHRRQDRINAALGLDWANLGDIRWACAVGADNVLVRFEANGTCHTTQRFDEVGKAAKAFGAKLLVIDTAADTFGGNENDRQQVRAFLGPVLTKLAKEIGGAVLVNAHPSRSGMSSSGDMDGGSTAWSNTARSRWALTRPIAEEGAEPDANARILTRRKANYASIGEEIRLQWRDGVLTPHALAAGPSGAPAKAAVEALFLTLLDRCTAQGQSVSESSHSPNFAPKVFAKRPDRDGYSRKEFDGAMASLFTSKSIRVAEYGRPGKWRSRIERDERNGKTEER